MRIHFTRGDVARTHLADGPDPLWEVVNSLQLLQGGYARAVFGQWRREAAVGLHDAALAGPVRARLFPVAPHASYFPDLLTPPEAALGVDEGIETILSTPRRRLGAEIGRLAGTGPWLADIGAGRAAAMIALGDLLRAYHGAAVAPYWTRLRVWIDRDLAARRHAIREGGAERLLDSFRPIMRWRYPVLELPDHPSDRDVHLEGRGLRLVPSYFCWHHPITIADSTLPQVVVYPVEHHRDWLGRDPQRPVEPVLSRLLGGTRAAVLLGTRGGPTTAELARIVGVSAATISHHTGALRAAGLIASHRTGNRVRHTLTPLGAALTRQG